MTFNPGRDRFGNTRLDFVERGTDDLGNGWRMDAHFSLYGHRTRAPFEGYLTHLLAECNERLDSLLPDLQRAAVMNQLSGFGPAASISFGIGIFRIEVVISVYYVDNDADETPFTEEQLDELQAEELLMLLSLREEAVSAVQTQLQQELDRVAIESIRAVSARFHGRTD